MMFPGQASQYPGMGKDLAEKFPAARAVFDEADKALGFSISKMCFEGSEDELKLTANTQPAILTVSVAAFRVLTGESGSLADTLDAGRVITTDREHDCVPEISAAKLPAALANSITFTLSPWSTADEGVIIASPSRMQ